MPGHCMPAVVKGCIAAMNILIVWTDFSNCLLPFLQLPTHVTVLGKTHVLKWKRYPSPERHFSSTSPVTASFIEPESAEHLLFTSMRTVQYTNYHRASLPEMRLFRGIAALEKSISRFNVTTYVGQMSFHIADTKSYHGHPAFDAQARTIPPCARQIWPSIGTIGSYVHLSTGRYMPARHNSTNV